MAQSKNKLDAAKELAASGFPVFPIKPNAKAPPLVREFPAKATTNGEQIAAWWTQYPEANIGIHCKDLLVIDVDADKGGFESLIGLEFANSELPATFEVKTPSGGRHFYFACPGGVPNGVNRLGPGLDIRSNNGYVLAPGSTTSDGAYVALREPLLADAPDWLKSLSQVPEPPQETTPAPEGIDTATAVQRAVEWLSQAPPAIEGQGGDHHTFAVACRVRDFGVPEEQALEVLHPWNSRCEPPWDPEELHRKIHNAYKYAQNTPGVNSVEAMFDIVQPGNTYITYEQDEELYTPDDVTLESVLIADYIVKGWLDKGAQGLLFGQWGSGKTFIALHAAAHIAAGEEWFGNRVKPGGVLYLGYEGASAMRKRLYALRREFPDWPMGRFMVRPMRWPLVRKNSDGAKTKGMEMAEGALKTFKDRTGDWPSLIIIDPLRNALGGSDSDADLTAPYLNYLQRLTKATGCSTLTVHHPGHAEAERGRGDSGIEAAMDTVIRVDGDRGRIETKKQRDDPKGGMYYRLRTVPLGLDSDGDERTTCVVEQVMENPLDPGLTDQQQKVLDSLREYVGEDEAVTKTLFRQAAQGLTSAVRSEIFETLLQKQYLVPEGKHKWRLGAGAAEMFD